MFKNTAYVTKATLWLFKKSYGNNMAYNLSEFLCL
jgi:hypothetical protein